MAVGESVESEAPLALYTTVGAVAEQDPIVNASV